MKTTALWALLMLTAAAAAQTADLPTLTAADSRTVSFAEKAACQRPVFQPGGKRVALFVGGARGRIIVVDFEGDARHIAWTAEAGAKVSCSQVAFSADGQKLGALLRHEKDGAVRRSVLVGPADGKLDWLGVESMAYEFSFSADGERVALATKAGIVVAEAKPGAKGALWLAGESTEQRRAPYTRIRFAPDASFVVAVGPIAEPFTVAGQGRGMVAFADGKHVDLGISTPYLSVSPDGKHIAAAVWTHSPVKVERPGGLMVWDVADLKAGKVNGRFVIDPARYISGLHVYPGATFWIDGKPSCFGTALKPEPGMPYRRFGVWQADLNGGPPKRLSICGVMPKRMWPDPGGRGAVFWRYYFQRGAYLLDDRTGRCLRLDEMIATTQYRLAFSDDLKRMAVVSKNQLILRTLKEGIAK